MIEFTEISGQPSAAELEAVRRALTIALAARRAVPHPRVVVAAAESRPIWRSEVPVTLVW